MQFPWFHRASRLVLATLLTATTLVVGTAGVTPLVSADVSDGWVNIDVGTRHTCGVTIVSEAFCWGTGNEGQLGDGTTNTLLSQFVPLEVPAHAGVLWASVNVGGYHSCALTKAADIYCWGIGSDGQVGNGDNPPFDFNPNPQLVVRPVGVSWASVTAGNTRTCALTTDGDAYCWGGNVAGQLGLGDTNDRIEPTLVPRQDGEAWVSLDAGVSDTNNFGGRLTCGVSAAGSGFCWGDDTEGELGNGDPRADVTSPALVAGGIVWSVIRPGLHHTCGVSTSGELWCWGNNESFQLGLGDITDEFYTSPQLVSSPAGVTFVDVDAGSFQTCALSTDGDAYCWGSEDFSFGLGDGNDTADQYSTPRLVEPPSGVAPGVIDHESLDVGPDRVCTVDSTNTGWCWGSDSWGALGDDVPSVNKSLPSQVGERTGGPQDMTFRSLRDRTLVESPVGLSATATSGLPVEFTAVGSCTVVATTLTLLSAGICEVTARQPGDANWDAARPIVQQFSIVDASPPQQIRAGFVPNIVNPGADSVVTFELSHPIGTVPAVDVNFEATFGVLTVGAVTANTCTTGAVTLVAGTLDFSGGSLDIGDECSISVSVTAPASAPSYPTSFSVSGGRLNSNLGDSTTSASATLLVDEGSGFEQTIVVPGTSTWTITDGDRLFPITSTSGLPVTVTTMGPCTPSGDLLSISGVGRCEITATQSGNATYAPAPTVERSFSVVKDFQTIDFAPLSDWPLNGGVRTMTATASSGLPVSYFATGVCSRAGAEITVTAVGTCTVRASQGGNDEYHGAANVERSFDVIANDQTIDFAALADWGLFDGARTLTATATSGLDVTFAATGPCAVAGSTLTVSAVGTCMVTASQDGGGAFGAALDVVRSFEVLPADQTIDFGVLGSWGILDGDRTLTATATSGLAVTFVAAGSCSVVGTTLSVVTTGVCQVTAQQAGNASFNPAPAVVRGFDVVGATQTIDFAAISDTALRPTIALSATASSGLDVTFAAAGACSVVGSTLSLNAPGTCAVTASQAGNTTFTAAVDVERTFSITKPPLGATLAGPAGATLVGTPATFVANIDEADKLPTPTGLVRFTGPGGITADVAVDAVSQTATWTVSNLPVGSNDVTAEYLGDNTFQTAGASSPVTHDVVTAPLGLTGLPDTVVVGQSVSVEAAGFHADETVTFVLNSDPVTVGTATSSATGSVSLTFDIPDVMAGDHQLTATGGSSGLTTSAATALQVASTTTIPVSTSPPTTPATPTTTPTTPATTTPTPSATTVPAVPDLDGELPATGRGAGPSLVWAALLIVVGATVAVTARRRKPRVLTT